MVTIIAVLLLVLVGEIGYISFQKYTDEPQATPIVVPAVDFEVSTEVTLEQFKSEEDFKEFLVMSESSGFNGNMNFGAGSSRGIEEATLAMAPTASLDSSMGLKEVSIDQSVSVDRYSETNVQVMGIDEPDLVKTDGKNIYYSGKDSRYYYEDRAFAPGDIETRTDTTRVINALPLDKLDIVGTIEENGNLLLKDNLLIVLTNKEIVSYDVSDPITPVEKWRYNYGEDTRFNTARLMGDQLYLITDSFINYNRPCPIEPLVGENMKVSIACGDIYHPSVPSYTDITYSAVKMNVGTGEVSDTMSIVGSYSNIKIYMSAENLYLGYYYAGDETRFMAGFINENNDIFPQTVISQVNKLMGYDLGDRAKEVELGTIMENWLRGLSKDDQLLVDNEMENRLDSYSKLHIRDLQNTTIMKVALDNLRVDETGVVPGRMLNQFSMDEHNGYLRVATTSGDGFSNGNSVNDVYVLDGNLKQTSVVLDMGEGERIYSVRFLGDEGYVVTFKQVDPFYVLDLSDPSDAKKVGELKIPGYSSYLHPLKENMILGLGKEDNQVKISMFDVSDPANPVEKAKYLLKEYWSDVLNTHHAYLQDEKHEIFFLPGNNGGYIFSYADDQLKLSKAVSDINPDRALFINDYLYVVSPRKVIVLDENSWDVLEELEIR